MRITKNNLIIPMPTLLLVCTALIAGSAGALYGMYRDQADLRADTVRISDRLSRIERDVLHKGQLLRDNDHSIGAPSPKLTLIVYSDIECPFCKKYHPTVRSVAAQHKDTVQLVFRHMPLSFHENARLEAEASECVAAQAGNDAFWSYVDTLFERTTSGGTGLSENDLYVIAEDTGVPRADLEICLSGPAASAKVDQDILDAEKIGVNGTPATVLVRADGTSSLLSGVLSEEDLTKKISKEIE